MGPAGLQRHRKALLGDLSSLVRLSKECELNKKQAQSHAFEEGDCSLLVLTAFKLLIRAVRFYDLWIQTILQDETQHAAWPTTFPKHSSQDVPPTPPAESGVFDAAEDSRGGNFSNTEKEISNHVTSVGLPRVAKRDIHEQETNKQETTDFRKHDPSSDCLPSCLKSGPPERQIAEKEGTWTSHRLSWLSKPLSVCKDKLASQRLVAANDAFLSFLSIFLSVHLITRTSTEILVNTQQSVNAGRSLLTVVEAVWDRDLCRSKQLEETRDSMYIKITNLVHAAQHIFQPLENTLIEDCEPADRNRLADAAMSCVRGAGDCVEATRGVLELIGDFEFETIAAQSAFSGVDFQSSHQFPQTTSSDRNSTLVEQFPMPPESNSTTPTNREFRLASVDNHVLTNEKINATPTARSPASNRTSSASNLPPPPSLTDSSSSLEDLSPVSITSKCSTKLLENDLVPAKRSSLATSNTPSGDRLNLSLSDARSIPFDHASFDPTMHTSITANGESPQSVSRLPNTNAKEQEVNEVEAKLMSWTFAHELSFNQEGQITGGTLPALIERLTASDARPDAIFVSTFYLTFRLFSSSEEVTNTLVERFKHCIDDKLTSGPVTLRVYNAFKGWLELHWQPEQDTPALPLIEAFARDELSRSQPGAAKRLLELTEKVSELQSPCLLRKIHSASSLNSHAPGRGQNTPMPFPVISKGQVGLLKAWKNGGASPSILDFEPLELARQLTVKASSLFCQIMPKELLGSEWTKKSGSIAHYVRAMSTLSTDLTNLVADTILHFDEHSKRAKIIKQWVKIASKCLELNNYDSLMAIVCSLNSTPVMRLKRTWDCVSSKTKSSLEELNSIVDCSKNYTKLRQRLLAAATPCLPFVGMYLTDLTFVEAGNSSTRKLFADGQEQPVTAINFDKHLKTARIISDLQRFQTPFPLQDVPELQAWLQEQFVRVRSSVDNGENPVNKMYRRSCLLEPRDLPSARPGLGSAVSSSSHIPRLQKREGEFMGITWR